MPTSALREALGDRADMLDDMNACDTAGCKDPAHGHPEAIAPIAEDGEMEAPDVGELDAAEPDWDVDPAVAAAVKTGTPMAPPANPPVDAHAAIGTKVA